jgi:hypothetical protein
LVIALSISSIHSRDANILGNVGGGGRFGNSTVGNAGKSGNSGISIVGSTGIAGKLIDTVGTSGRYKFGKFGNNIGRVPNVNSGRLIVSHALILCKSIIISGHFGN